MKEALLKLVIKIVMMESWNAKAALNQHLIAPLRCSVRLAVSKLFLNFAGLKPFVDFSVTGSKL